MVMDLGKEIIGGVVSALVVILVILFLNTFQKSIEESAVDSNTKQITSNIIENAKTSIWIYYILVGIVGIIPFAYALIKFLSG
jgi:nicotinamide riboside transporter PnuC